MLVAGTIMAVLQPVVFPGAIKVIKFTICQCLLAVPAFIAVQYGKGLSWNDSSLFAVSVASIYLVYCSTAMVSQMYTFTILPTAELTNVDECAMCIRRTGLPPCRYPRRLRVG